MSAPFDDDGRRLSLAELKALIDRLAAEAGVRPGDLPTYGRSEDGARPHIEVEGDYHWVVVERGQELERKTTASLDEVLYAVFDAATFSTAMTLPRDPAKDFRRQLFEARVEMMTRLSPAWGERLKQRLDAAIAANP